MREIVAIVKFEWRRLLKKRSTLFVMFVMPLLFTFLFGKMYGDDEDHVVKIGLVSAQAEQVMNGFTVGAFQLHRYETKQAAKTAIREREIVGYVLLQDGQKPQFRYSPDFVSHETFTAMFSNHLRYIEQRQQLRVSVARYGGDEVSLEAKVPTINRQHVTAGESTKKVMGTQAIGFTLMFVMIIVMSSTGIILEARENGTFRRLLTTGTARGHILIGFISYFFSVGMLQFGLLIGLSRLLFNVQWGNGGALFVLMVITIACFVTLGLAIASFVRTVEQQGAFTNLTVTVTCMIGGVYWPLTIVPMFMQQLAWFVPQKWAIDAFSAVMLQQQSLAHIAQPIFILLAFTVLFFTIGIHQLKWE